MKKRTLSLALALMMCLALLPMTASALSNDTFEYTLSGDEVYITKLLDQSIEDLVIPSTIDGKPVTQIDGIGSMIDSSNTNRINKTIKSVTIPSTVKVVCERAFADAKNLTSVTFPDSLETIGNGAFDSSGLKTAILPDSVTNIGRHAFRDCKDLTEVKLPNGLTEISEELFRDCSNLTSIQLPTTVRTIKSRAFGGSGLVSLTIPKGVTEIPSSMCYQCKNLSKVELPAGLTALNANAFNDCEKLESILLPTTVTSLADGGTGGTFAGSGLKELIIPYGVETSWGTCMGCESLTAIYVPSTVEQITSVPKNAIVYCMPGSKLEAYCKKEEISYQTDASVDTRINVIYNGKRVSFGAYGQNPEIVSNRTMVPLRSIFEAMGAQVQWDGATKTVTATRGSDKIVMTAGQNGYTVNGAAKTMDAPPMIMNGRTMVPVRAVAESFGANVTWHSPSATVIISE